MDAETVHDVLRVLKEIRRNWSDGTRDRAAQERLDELIARLERSASEGGSAKLSRAELLRELSTIIGSIGKFADLIASILKKLF